MAASAITPQQAASALLRFDQYRDQLVFEGMNNGLNFALELSITKFMVGGTSRDPIEDPPNAPPGPLKIRSGNLRQRMKRVDTERQGDLYVGGLSNDAKYAAIHEFGGRTGAHFIEAREADTLAFVGRDGNMVFREAVFHPGSNIPARPYMEPALEAAKDTIMEDIAASLTRGVERAIAGTL